MDEKQIIAKKLIDLHNKVEKVELEAEVERRQLTTNFNRTLKEIKVMAIGNKKDIKKLFKRTDDNIEKIETLQGYIQWLLKVIVGIILTVTLTMILNTFFRIF